MCHCQFDTGRCFLSFWFREVCDRIVVRVSAGRGKVDNDPGQQWDRADGLPAVLPNLAQGRASSGKLLKATVKNIVCISNTYNKRKRDWLSRMREGLMLVLNDKETRLSIEGNLDWQSRYRNICLQGL